MKETKNVSIWRRIEASACGFLGSAFIILGVIYITPQQEYHVPRILLPIFDLLGNIGLAVGMLLLGMAMIAYAYYSWRKHGGSKIVYMLLVVVFIALFSVLSIIVSGSSSNDMSNSAEKQNQSMIMEIKNMERPEFDAKVANDFIDAHEKLLADYQVAIDAKDQSAILASQEAYVKLMQTMSTVIKTLSDDEKQIFGQYNAKLSMAWADISQP